MRNRYFTDELLGIIEQPERWRIVSSFLRPERPEINIEKHLKWMKAHTDSHPAREALVCFSGKGYCGFKGKLYLCDPGTVFFFDAFAPHDRLYPPHYPDSVHMWLIFLNNITFVHLYDIRGGKSNRTASFFLKNDPYSSAFCMEWDAAVSGKLPDSFRRAKMVSAFSSFLLHVAEKGYSPSRPKDNPDHTEEIMEGIMQNIKSSGGHGFNLAKTAKLAGMSKFHFHRMFREYAGETLHSFVDKCRLKKVGELKKEGRNMTEISDSLGFSSLSVFLRWLKMSKSNN
ncbi:MAG TPA: hypothetical protein DET40_00270 [Lentisphaeria bacterium]|nr:MAG: hypothetical protein A2X45_10815 [Lentisphaerae bacterium GWF2_50_93]HCE41967.1 hypothetical protein [Lentisphaeria bacterium]